MPSSGGLRAKTGRAEDRKSEEMLYRLYLGLKVIRPTRGRYQVLHYDMNLPVPRLPRGYRNDYGTIICDCELLNLNSLRWKDFQDLVAVARSILGTLNDARNPVSQAVQSLEIGYRADFLNVRHLLWVVGLDALFTSIEWENQGIEVSVGRITHFLGLDFAIYSEKPHYDYDSGPTLPNIRLSDVLRDVYRLRNDFAHGTWPDKQWAGKVSRRSADGSRDIYYAEVVSEAASISLRGCLKKILADAQLVQMFTDKTRMNAHFAACGLVRKRKK
jgi:hypothetical protein